MATFHQSMGWNAFDRKISWQSSLSEDGMANSLWWLFLFPIISKLADTLSFFSRFFSLKKEKKFLVLSSEKLCRKSCQNSSRIGSCTESQPGIDRSSESICTGVWVTFSLYEVCQSLRLLLDLSVKSLRSKKSFFDFCFFKEYLATSRFEKFLFHSHCITFVLSKYICVFWK